MSETVMIVVTGMLIVFFVLILLTLFIVLIGKSIAASENVSMMRKSKKSAVPIQISAEQQDIPASNAVTSVPMTMDAVDNDDNELTAVISAAIAMIYQSEGNPNNFAVKSIRRVVEGRPIWATAGIAEATRPF